jgi:hypothetical protein
MFLKKSSVIEMLYDHLSYYSFNFFKISNIYTHQKNRLKPPKPNSQTYIHLKYFVKYKKVITFLYHTKMLLSTWHLTHSGINL